jgi:uncharacterized repeat protein (TIGR01451 family)
MSALTELATGRIRFNSALKACLLALPLAVLAFPGSISAQLLDPLQVVDTGQPCPADQPGAPNNFACTSNDIKLDLVQLSGITECIEGEMATATFDIDLQINANIRYNPMVWISENGIDPRTSGGLCFVSSIPDGPIDHIPELFFADANECADVDVPSNNFTLSNLTLGSVQFLCVDSDGDQMADIPIIVTWSNSAGAACGQGGPYPINETPSKCDAFSATTDIAVIQNPALSLVKVGTLDLGGNGVANPGDLINYTFEVTNTGDTDLTDITVSDPLVSPITCPGGNPILSLAPGASVTCTGSYAITQADIDAGSRSNIATAAGQDPGGNPISDIDTHDEPIPQAGAVDIVKDGTLDLGGDGAATPGDLISYTFQVSNIGNVALSDIAVTDPLVSPITCPGGNPIPSLAAGASVTCTGSYAITQADIDAGNRPNTVTAAGQDPGGNPVSDTDTHVEPIPQNATVDIVKGGTLDVGGDGAANPGDLISYTFEVTNTGNVPLSNVAVTDPLVSPIACPSGNPIPSLAPGASETCTGSYAITQADIDAGSVPNTATATGQDPGGNPVTDTDNHEEPIPQGGAVDIVKDGVLDLGGDGTATPGDLINYTFQVSNIGNVTLNNIAVSDPLVIPITCPGGNPIPSLAVGESQTCSGSYAITQADIDTGSVPNTATATGEDPGGNPVIDTDTHEEPIPQGGAVDIVKDGALDLGGDGTATPGDLINYSFVVTNAGNVVLNNITVTDPLVSPITCPGGNPIPSLAPGASQTCTGSYAITQADIDAGSVPNTATATGEDPGGNPITDTDNHEEPIPQAGVIGLVKDGTLDLGGDGTATPGDLINYSFQVTNTGNVTLSNITVSDPLVSPITCPGGNPIPSLAPGASQTCTGSYAITQADIDAGSRSNTATAAGEDPGGAPVSDTDTHNEPIPQASAIELLKTGALDLGGDGVANPGDLINYSFQVTNNGNTDLTNVSVTDPMVAPITCPSGNPIPTLAVGATETCTGSYAITQTDIDAGSKFNTATASGQDPAGTPVTDTDTHEEPIPQLALVELVKDGALDLGGDGTANPGDLINYTFVVSNTGNQTLTAVVVSDPLVSPITCPSGNPIPTLAIGASETCTGSYAITQADIDAGSVPNTATAAGQDPAGTPVTDTDTHDEPIPQAAAIDLVKDGTLDPGADVVANPGDLINYTFVVSNTGNAALSDVTVSDPLVSPITCPSGNPIPSLAPGASETCTGSYAITQADIDAGSVLNTATATGQDPAGTPVTDTDTHEEPIPQAAVIELVKDGTLDDGGDGVANAGDSINYTFSVTNTGNVELTNVTVTDPLIIVTGGPLASLAPGATDSTTFTGSYVLTQADVDAGTFTNVATATGTPPDPLEEVSDDDDHVQDIPREPGISLVKSSTTTEITGLETVPYTYDVTNTGNVTLSNIVIDDDNDEDDASCAETVLAPDQATQCTATREIVLDDWLAYGSPFAGSGELMNNATVTGTPPPDLVDVTAQDTLVIPFAEPFARFRVTKEFSDGDLREVEVRITCNTGLPLDQTFRISEGSPVNFVVNSFLPGSMNCHVREAADRDDAYAVSYDADETAGVALDIYEDDAGCYYDGVVTGQFICEITNQALPATFTVWKDWVIPNTGGDEVNEEAQVTITCDSEIFNALAENPAEGVWTLSGSLGDGESLTAEVDTAEGPASCGATEQVLTSGVESTDDCAARDIPAGGSDSCTFTNTVFFEAIPTLSGYGLAILALLMLGVGFIGFRRFA